MLVAVNAFLINSNDHVYRSRMTLMDSEYQLEQTPRLLMQVFWGINDTFRICICILLDSDCLHSWYTITNHKGLKRAIADDRHNIYRSVRRPDVCQVNCISVDKRQVHDIFSINHDQSALFYVRITWSFYFHFLCNIAHQLNHCVMPHIYLLYIRAQYNKFACNRLFSERVKLSIKSRNSSSEFHYFWQMKMYS